jgi:hypothetical protein
MRITHQGPFNAAFVLGLRWPSRIDATTMQKSLIKERSGNSQKL